LKKPRTNPARDPASTRKRILAAAQLEFAREGLGGARIDRIAERAKTNKRMLYHYFGNKEALYTLTLEEAYADFREAEENLQIEKDDPVTAIKRIVEFTWNYYVAHPDFIRLVNTENLHKAAYLSKSGRLDNLNKSFVGRMTQLLQRGVKAGLFRSGLDAIHVLITIAAVNYHYLTNQFTGRIVYRRELMSPKALSDRLRFNKQTILRMVCTPQTILELETH
jgi:AcrR family transcriptional regulator